MSLDQVLHSSDLFACQCPVCVAEVLIPRRLVFQRVPDRAAFGCLVTGEVAVNVRKYLRPIWRLQLPHRLDEDTQTAFVITSFFGSSARRCLQRGPHSGPGWPGRPQSLNGANGT